MSRTKLPTRLMRRPPRRSHSPKRRCARASSGRTSVTPVRVGRHDEQRHAAPAELTEAGVPHDLRSIRERNIPFSTTRCGTTTLAPRPTRGNGCSPSSRSTSSAPLQRRALNPNGLCLPRAVANWPRIGPAAYRTMTQEDGLRGEANSQVDGHLIASPQVAVSSREPSQGGVVVRGDSYWRGRRQRTNLIRQPPLMQATPPHPPSCTGDGGRHDVREDPFPRSAMSTRSSLAPEDRPLLRSASPTVASARSTCPPRPLHDPASCRRPYPFEVTRHPLDAPHHWEVVTDVDSSTCH
jgi:hypothetical protein